MPPTVFSFLRAGQRVFGLLACLAFAAAAQAQVAGVLGSMPEDYFPGLKPLLESAVKQSPDVLQEMSELEDAEARVYLEEYRKWPQAGGEIKYNSNRAAISGNESTQVRASGLFYSVSASQALFHWGEIRNRSKVARISVLAAERNFAEAYRLLAVEIRRTYLNLVWQHAQLRQVRDNVALKEAELAHARDRYAREQTSLGDVVGRELVLDEARLELERAQMLFDAERRRLARMAGVPEIRADDLPHEIPPPRYDPELARELLAGMLRDGAQDTFRAEVARLGIEQADLKYKIARVRLLPKFDATVSHSRESSTSALPNELSQTAITRETFEIRGNWSIFDGFATRGAKLQAKAERRMWERRLKAWTEQAMDEAQTLERVVNLEARAMQLAERRRVGAVSGVQIAEEDFKAQRSPKTLLDQARNNLQYAEWNAARARASFLSEWAAFVSRVADDPILNHLSHRHVRAQP